MVTKHFITGLPRSGTTLLGAILQQNPQFKAGMSSPLGQIIDSSLRAMSPSANEFAVHLSDSQKRRIVTSVFDAYFGEWPDKEVFFDTSRLWAAKLPFIREMFPDSKVIACVRNPAWVMDSIEKLVRKNALNVSRMFVSEAERATVYSRTEALMQPSRMIGYSLAALQEGYYADEADRLLLVEYDILCARPEETLGLIYDFLGSAPFAHDFENLEYRAEEFDKSLDTPDLHTVRRKVSLEKRRPVLPPDLFERLSKMMFWREMKGSRAKAIVAQAPEDTQTDNTPQKPLTH